MKLLEFFSEENGRLSNGRLNSTLALWAGIGLSVWSAIQNVLYNHTVPFEILILLFTYGAGQKLIQKPFETRVNGNGNNKT